MLPGSYVSKHQWGHKDGKLFIIYFLSFIYKTMHKMSWELRMLCYPYLSFLLTICYPPPTL